MRRTARPARVSARLPMLSFGSGGVPGAGSHLTAPVTRYVPLPVPTLLASNVVQEPPPVASSSLPSSTWNVPDPVTVIFELSLALGAGARLMHVEGVLFLSMWRPASFRTFQAGSRRSRTFRPRPATLWYPGGTLFEASQFSGYHDVIFSVEL